MFHASVPTTCSHGVRARIDVQLTGNVQTLAGPEIAASYVASNAEVVPSLGRNLAGDARNITVNIVEPGTMYGERLTQVDLRVGKIFRVGGLRTTASLDLYNALNANPVLSQNEALPRGSALRRFCRPAS